MLTVVKHSDLGPSSGVELFCLWELHRCSSSTAGCLDSCCFPFCRLSSNFLKVLLQSMALLNITLPSPDWIHDTVFNLSAPFICLSTGALSRSGFFFLLLDPIFTLNNEPLPHFNAPVCPSLFPSLLWRLFLSQAFATKRSSSATTSFFHLHKSFPTSICISQVTAAPPNTSKAKLASNHLLRSLFFFFKSELPLC